MGASRDSRPSSAAVTLALAAQAPDDRFDALGPDTPEDERLEVIREEQIDDPVAGLPPCRRVADLPCLPDCELGLEPDVWCSRQACLPLEPAE